MLVGLFAKVLKCHLNLIVRIAKKSSLLGFEAMSKQRLGLMQKLKLPLKFAFCENIFSKR